jgi:sensor histidine kinase regulating citrate/malate metabolism
MIRLLSKGKVQAIPAILVVDSNRRMVSMNRKFIEMWRFPQHIIVSQDEDQALELASKRVVHSKSFLKSIQEIYIHTELEIYDTIKLKDGRIFERKSMPQYLKDKCVGRIWKFRDLTDDIVHLVEKFDCN